MPVVSYLWLTRHCYLAGQLRILHLVFNMSVLTTAALQVSIVLVQARGWQRDRMDQNLVITDGAEQCSLIRLKYSHAGDDISEHGHSIFMRLFLIQRRMIIG